MRPPHLAAWLGLALLTSSCSWLIPSEIADAGVPGRKDAGHASHVDAGLASTDAGAPTDDAGSDGGETADAGRHDAGEHDAGAPDAGAPDAGAPDPGAPDAGAPDAGGPADAGTPVDAGPPRPDAGPPSDLPLGAACTAASECASGHCAEGRCCTEACDGECEACDESGACLATPGATCESNPLACRDYVHSLDEIGGACYAYADVTVDGRCAADRTCVSDATRCDDEGVPRGPALVECDRSCLILPISNACQTGAPAEWATLEAVCTLNAESPMGCESGCQVSGGTGRHHTARSATCNENGRCDERLELCGDYICIESANGEPTCLTTCTQDADCMVPFLGQLYCVEGDCVACRTDEDCGNNSTCLPDHTCG